MAKSDDEKRRITEEFDLIQESSSGIYDIGNHLASAADLPDLGHIEIYDYDTDLQVASSKGSELLQGLVDLYLGDMPDIKDHPYIKSKQREDATVYAETLFLQKMARRALLTQMRQVDNGDNSSRMHDVVINTIKTIRENSEFSSSQRTKLEKYYRDFRNDLLEVAGAKTSDNTSTGTGGSVDGAGGVLDNADLNDRIAKAMAAKKAAGK
jgi:hypothetical protein